MFSAVSANEKVFMIKGEFGKRPPPNLQMFNRIKIVQLLPSAHFFINTLLGAVILSLEKCQLINKKVNILKIFTFFLVS
jgi:hypothetical protein